MGPPGRLRPALARQPARARSPDDVRHSRATRRTALDAAPPSSTVRTVRDKGDGAQEGGPPPAHAGRAGLALLGAHRRAWTGSPPCRLALARLTVTAGQRSQRVHAAGR